LPNAANVANIKSCVFSASSEGKPNIRSYEIFRSEDWSFDTDV